MNNYTIEEMEQNGFFKIAQHGSVYITAMFYNPTTDETKQLCVRDYDYSDCSRDNDSLYYAEINENIHRIFELKHGIVRKGDTIKVFKGRTIKHGTVGIVNGGFTWYDKYKRPVCDYIYLTTGEKIAVHNCLLVSQYGECEARCYRKTF